MILMKIAIVTPSYYPIVGGTESAVQSLASELNERGVHADVITFNMDKKWEPVCRWKIEKTNGFNIIRTPALNSPRLSFRYKINPLEKLFLLNVIPQPSIIRILQNYSIIHFHDEVDLSFPLFSYFVRKPKILHFHSLGYTWGFYKKNALCKSLLRGLFQYYICNSNESLRLLLDLGIDKEKISVIPNSVNLEKFSTRTYMNHLHEPEKDLVFNHNTKKIVFVSRLSNEKLIAITSTIKAVPKIVQKIPNAQIILVGGGPCFDYINTLAERINKQLARKAVVVMDEIKDARGERIAKIMNLADVVIGIGRVALEGMALGKPVIIAGSTLGTLGGNFGGIVTEENVTHLKDFNFSGRNSSEKTTHNRIAEAVIELLSDEKYRQSIGEFGRRFVEKEHDIQKIAEEIEAIYNTILKEDKKARM